MTDLEERIPDISDFLECSAWLVLAGPDNDESGFDRSAWVDAAWSRLLEQTPGLSAYGSPAWNNGHCHLSFYRFANHGGSGVAMLRRLVSAFPAIFPNGYGVIHFRAADEAEATFRQISIGAQIQVV